ncbi:DEAD/DEAH box helicase [Sphingomonas sp. LY160]|uniref:DEAD/DEAH box helicase n=1 Tax=Sphingomonas sp. LY160 TaxID=3095342 RepID=UPI002ADEEDBD|nr:DEAD/DEAH box helicase [Sphingomonas sp. LY160]MEA1071764.1 DEAD/DEAH box helicase [Sphingomonas sp. LY160]
MADADPMRPQTGPLRTFELIRDRAVEAVLGQSGLNHAGLADEIRRQFGATEVEAGALVREPLIEGAAPFVSSGRTFADFAGDPLHPDVIRAISSVEAGDYRFPPDAQPYKHQAEAWRHLSEAERRSVLVSSGTGSGKTECFLMPLLSDLATEADASGKLSGVRAIALYPLNALIASQKERLSAWTAPFGDRVRFGLYNGLTPEKPSRTERPTPEQVGDRETLRRDPPPILVTNVTMLEYMIVRRIDRSLIENSRGKLRWIILDEAHSYIGSAAAEIALLIRRVLLTFGVEAEDVRFVATSATIGDGKDVTDELRRFLRDLSGADEGRVKVVIGEREQVLLPPAASSPVLTPIELTHRDRVAASPAVQSFVRAAEVRPLRLDEVREMLAPTGEPTERVIEAIADDTDDQRGPLLPLRIHGFLRAVPGLWSCLNLQCPDAPRSWPFGAVLAEKADSCPACRSPVLEVKTCRECGEPYLECEESDGYVRAVTTAPTVDEFAALAEREISGGDDSDGDGEDESEQLCDHPDYEARIMALAVRPLDGRRTANVELATGRSPDRADDTTVPIGWHDPATCGACGAESGGAGPMLRPLRYGAPFLIGNAAPVLLDGAPRRTAAVESAYRPPADGRQILSFTDSRQGTARFAANLQTNAERGYVRGFLYHAAQGSMAAASQDNPRAMELRGKIDAMEKAAPDALAELIAMEKAQLAAVMTPSTIGTAWNDMKAALAAAPETAHWMARVWGMRDDRYRSDPLAFAEFLLLRELARRPRRANTAETMGLVRLRFDAIERALDIPEPIEARGFETADWQGLLYNIVDMVVRANFAIRATWDDAHWLHSRTPLSMLLPPGEQRQGGREVAWPMIGKTKGNPSNLVMILEKALGLDRSDAQDRARLNIVLEAAWTKLQPLFHDVMRPGYALDFAKARIAPVTDAWRCPVTRRVLATTALGFTPYGHRDGLKTANEKPQPLAFPRLPATFPRGDQVDALRNWLDTDAQIATLRGQGVWSNLHDRVALLSPYLRAAEHSAQQPPARLRRFEGEFKKGEINILNCSTTMEMGVDIGSVAAVMMTNVPPALANYRQRVGRAGRRRQGFASALTYTRDTPLDREAFRDPQAYLARQTSAPRVKLDSRRIVQRHVNALLLARWFASAGGEAMKTRMGDFFGLPGEIGAERVGDAAVAPCLNWLVAPSTVEALSADVTALVRGTALAGNMQIFAAARDALQAAWDGASLEWEAIQQQAVGAPKEGKDSLGFQLKRLVTDNLLKELGYRGVLPAHGFPTGVVPFVNDDKLGADERGAGETDDSSRRRRSFPTRTLDIAIRDYAPGAEVVVDGLVYRSAGVTLNWLRPADDAEAREIQSLKSFWNCPACGAADCAHAVPANCPACHAEVPLDAQRRFLEPAGFTADMRAKPHADTDEVTFVEPETEQIVARGAAWAPMADPSEGRMRSSSEGLVFYSSRGPQPKLGYHICLDCGRAAPAAQPGGDHPLRDHEPLRFTKKGSDGRCPGNDKPFKVTPPIALGYETVTDVAELQPVGLESTGAAWAAVSALREALTRQLGIETSEIGIAVRPAATPLGQRTHSLFLYDRASGGAGFAPQVVTMWERLLVDSASILDCDQLGCMSGCSACVLTADLYRQAEIIDRQAALIWAKAARVALADVPELDRVAPDAALARSVSDDIAEAIDRGARAVIIWPNPESDIAELGLGRVGSLARRAADRGATLALSIPSNWLDALDPAARLGLRDSAIRLGFELKRGVAPRFDNGAVAVAALGGDRSTIWASRDASAGVAGESWGQGSDAPTVRFTTGRLPLAATVDLDELLPISGTRFIELRDELDGNITGFGDRMASMLLPSIRAVAGKTPLTKITYSDRYLQSPLVARLMTEALASLRDALGVPGESVPVKIITNRLRPNERQPFGPEHDWQWEEDRAAVLLGMMEKRALTPELVEKGADHGRMLTITFADGRDVRIVFDQGFGPWRTPRYARWDHFGDAPERQIVMLAAFSAMVTARGPSYVVVTG